MDQSFRDSSGQQLQHPRKRALTVSSPSVQAPVKRTHRMNEDEFEEEAEENLSVETDDEIRAGPVSFMSRWKAVAGKEVLSGAQSQKLNTDTIFYHSIVVWRDSVVARCLPRKFNINKLEAAVYYERQPKADVFLQEIHDRADLYRACSLITDLHEQHPSKQLSLNLTLYLTEEVSELVRPTPSPVAASSHGNRRSSTQLQEGNLAEILATEEASGNRIPALASRWSCLNIHCPNKGNTCWQNKRGSETDRAEHHYPVSAHILQRWSREIQGGESTVEEPSQNIVCQLSAWKTRKQLKTPEPKNDPPDHQFKELVQLLTVRELQAVRRDQQNQPQLFPPSTESLQTSSPIRSDTDHSEILSQFFVWLMAQPGYDSERQRQILESIRDTLVDEDWDLDTLKSPDQMTIEIWKEYGFKLGTLPRLRQKISEFKSQRNYISQSSI
jgi:hypothetical protein